jgi:hypothetical protein
MGRPINKRNFGTGAGKLAVKFYDGSSVVTGYVLAQVGSDKFKVSKMDNSVQKVVRLVQNAGELALLTSGTPVTGVSRADLGTVEVGIVGGGTENVKKIISETRVQTVTGTKNVTMKRNAGNTAWATSATAGDANVTAVANSAPTVANAIPNQTGTVAGAFSYVIPANTFVDLNADTLVLSGTTTASAALSTIGFAFDPVTRTLSKAAGASTVGAKTINIKADDGTANVTATFTVTLS